MPAQSHLLLRNTAYALAAVALSALAAPAHSATETLIEPRAVIADGSLSKSKLATEVLAARRYATFWSTGDETLARAALAPDFTDRTLPAGRQQGIEGPLAASKTFHTAVPDLKVEVAQLIVAGDRVVSHLHFTGHFTGQFQTVKGQGQTIDFIATDIYRIADGRISENWHIEDNLTLLQQMGVVGK